jgi:membrane protein
MISAVFREFRDKELLVQASAISFRVLVAVIPTTLFVIAVLGAIGLEEAWQTEAGPEVRANVSASVYSVIDDAVTRVLEGQNLYWITIGAVLAIFAMASIVDAVTRTLNRIHEVEDSRSLIERGANAVLIGAVTGLLLLAAIAVVRLGPFAFDAVLGDGFAVDVLSFVVRWTVAAGLLTVVVALMVRVAPDMERPLRRVKVGAAITVAGWIVVSVLFGLYLEYVARYDTIFGNLATVYIAVQYIALSAIVYIGGLVIDAVAVREDANGPRADSAEDRSRRAQEPERAA